jgi:hypothetical protein
MLWEVLKTSTKKCLKNAYRVVSVWSGLLACDRRTDIVNASVKQKEEEEEDEWYSYCYEGGV